MDENLFQSLVKKAEAGQITPAEKLEFIRELNNRLENTNTLLKKALEENPEQ